MKISLQSVAAFAIVSGLSGCDRANERSSPALVAGSPTVKVEEGAVYARGAQTTNADQGAAAQSQSGFVDKCRDAGEGRFASARYDVCGGTWNVYASIKGGWTWWGDKTGLDSAAQKIDAQAAEVQAKLRQCGITAHVSLSDWFDSFTPDLVVVHSSPHSDRKQAAAELGRANACNLQGYSKASAFQIVGRD